jgi:hypothetical protein
MEERLSGLSLTLVSGILLLNQNVHRVVVRKADRVLVRMQIVPMLLDKLNLISVPGGLLVPLHQAFQNNIPFWFININQE